METQTLPEPKTEPIITLHQLIDQLVISFLPKTARQKSFIINDVKQEMQIGVDKNMLASVISCLLNATISLAQNNCIRVSAKSYGNVTLVHVKNNNTCDEVMISQNLQQAQQMAGQLGGCVSVSENKTEGTIVAFTFANDQKVA